MRSHVCGHESRGRKHVATDGNRECDEGIERWKVWYEEGREGYLVVIAAFLFANVSSPSKCPVLGCISRILH